MTIRVLLFSVLKDQLGVDHLALRIRPGTTGEGVLHELASQYPIIANYQPYIRLAVNASYVTGEVVLEDGDDVALITPTSGG